MHLRGPLNISQLAVYQLPDEIHTMQRRNTVPFYNRRRALNSRDITSSKTKLAQPPKTSKAHWLPFFNKRRHTTSSCVPMTVASTVTLTDCLPSSIAEPMQNITYIGPPLPCLPTPELSSSSTNYSSSTSNCTCESAPSVTIASHLPRLTPSSPG